MVQWITEHQAILIPAASAMGVAIIDFLIAVKPEWKSSGAVHWLYLLLGGKEGQ